ncbi:N-acetylmuramoyl-L-alanine amidase [Nocardioides sp. NPDC092400]|uniref:N-acetylmuramoyl-L-alanine amidase n=1 Tax=Nocardioides sp. NPDC092400 TaxID=3155196 RepID=UPI0034218A5E
MSRSKDRFVTGCQQLLALGAVLAVLTPAARVLTLDVVHEAPGTPALGLGESNGVAVTGRLSAYAAEQAQQSVLPAEPVDPVVTEYALSAPANGRLARGALHARTRVQGRQAVVVAEPQPVRGYGAVGVTWQHGEEVADDAITFQVRTETGGAWTGWSAMAYHDEHGPDPDSAEARRARPGTDELLVGEVDRVQVRVRSEAGVPDDMRLAVVDPGEADDLTREAPALHATGGDAPAPPATDTTDTATTATADATAGGAMALSAAAYTPRPVVYSRAQWGANEKLRGATAPSYYEVHAGFVHHTVNANEYTRDEVPGILRSIYAYHTQSRGWSDVGYNFLVDRFGRIWEGRYGGIDRPVVGAHTLGYNENSFAMSAIGNFDVKQPSSAMVQAYGALFAWKLSLHGVDASSPSQVVGKKSFRAINGHRDAGSTACPGRYLYAKLGKIRTLAAQDQIGWAGRERESDLVGTPHPDLLVRNATDGLAYVLPLVADEAGTVSTAAPVPTGIRVRGADALLSVGDWDRDGFGDMVVRTKATGVLKVRRGDGTGHFSKAVPIGSGFGGVSLLSAAGDMTGDGWPDLLGQPAGGAMRVYPGRGLEGLAASYVVHSRVSATQQVAVGRWDADGAPDSLLRVGNKLTLYPGNGPGGLTSPRALGMAVSAYDWLVGVSDVGLTGHADVVARSRADGRLWLLPGTPTGFGARVPLGEGASAYDLVG